ncbi:hypothetical protein GCM10028816_16750 [Spirosoma lituiforme]
MDSAGYWPDALNRTTTEETFLQSWYNEEITGEVNHVHKFRSEMVWFGIAEPMVCADDV